MSRGERDPDHWLWRLDAPGWLAAARAEIMQGRSSLDARRRALTHARRGAGMALNAVLRALADGPDPAWDDARCTSDWGRSYIDHLRAVAAHAEGGPGDPQPLGAEAAAEAAALMRIPVVPAGGLVTLSRAPGGEVAEALDTAARLVERCAAWVCSSMESSPPTSG